MAISGQSASALTYCVVDIALTCCDNTEGDPGFGRPHGRALGAVEISARTDHLVSKVPSELVLGQHAVAVHGVEVELGRVHYEVVIEVLGVGQGVQEATAAVECDFGLAPVADPCLCLGFLAGQLHRDAVVWCGICPGPRCGDDAVIVTAGECHPGSDFMCPCLDFGMLGFGAE